MPKTPASPGPHPSPDPTPSAPTRITPSALPAPTYTPQDPTKKTHARKQPAGHVPRPRNAFILFRCDFVRQGKVPADVENDHRNISRIAGRVWREMGVGERAPWLRMAEEEKRVHGRVNPGYRYTPHMVPPAGRRRKGEVEAVGKGKGMGMEAGRLRRTSSCPDLPESQSLPRDGDERTGMAQRQRLLYFPPLITHASTQRHKDAQPTHPKPLEHHRLKHEYPHPQSWARDVGLPMHKPSPHPSPLSPPSPPTATTTPPKATNTHPHTPPTPLLSLRRPSSCPPGAPRISSAHLTHPTATSALQLTRDDLARRPSRVPMYQSSPTALLFPGSGPSPDSTLGLALALGVACPGGAEPPYARALALGKNSRPPLLNGPYRIDPPRDAPGWDAPPPLPMPIAMPQVDPWVWGWSGAPMALFDQLDPPPPPQVQQHVYGEVARSDLEGISRAGAEGISPVDIEMMLRAQEPETASPPSQSHVPVFTNPFAPVPMPVPMHTQTHMVHSGELFVGPYGAASNFEVGGLSGVGFGGAGDDGVRSGVEGASHGFGGGEEALMGLLFPRMSLDDRV